MVNYELSPALQSMQKIHNPLAKRMSFTPDPKTKRNIPKLLNEMINSKTLTKNTNQSQA